MTQPLSTVKMYNNDFDLFASDDFASNHEGLSFSAVKAPTAFSNAFGIPTLRAVDDAVLESPLGLSPLSLSSSSPFDASFADDLSPMICGTPDLLDESVDMPSLFHPWPTSNSTSFEPTQSLFPSSTVPPEQHSGHPPSASPASVSPQLMTLDHTTTTTTTTKESKESAEARLARARQVAQQVLSEDKKPVKDKFTGTRNTSLPMIDMDAPTMSRSWIIPATTSRKRAPPPAADKPAPPKKRGRGARASSTFSSSSSSTHHSVSAPPTISPDDAEQIEELPDEVLTAIELKRRQNTLAARRSRQRKANHLAELQGQIDVLQTELEDWKAKCAQLEETVRRLGGSQP